MIKKLCLLFIVNIFHLKAADHKYDLAAHYMHSVRVAKSTDRLSIEQARTQRQKEAVLGLLALPRTTQRLENFYFTVAYIQKYFYKD